MYNKIILAAIATTVYCITPEKKSVGQTAKSEAIGEFMNKDQFAKFFKPGNCHDVGMMNKLDYVKLSGDWYMHGATALPQQLRDSDCHHCVIQADATGNYFTNKEMRLGGH